MTYHKIISTQSFGQLDFWLTYPSLMTLTTIDYHNGIERECNIKNLIIWFDVANVGPTVHRTHCIKI